LELNIIHISDLHFGAIGSKNILESLALSIDHLRPSRVIISGDLTQRARRREFEAAKQFIEPFNEKCRTVPGNHDLEPWWKPVKRLFNPQLSYRYHFGSDTSEILEGAKVGLVYLDSSNEKYIQGGKIEDEYLKSSLLHLNPSAVDWLIIVSHHPLLHTPSIRKKKLCKINTDVLIKLTQPFERVIFLAGHTHAHLLYEIERDGDRALISNVCGTTTSFRTRRSGRNCNTFTNLRFSPTGDLIVDMYLYEIESGRWLQNDQLSRTFQGHKVGDLSRSMYNSEEI